MIFGVLTVLHNNDETLYDKLSGWYLRQCQQTLAEFTIKTLIKIFSQIKQIRQFVSHLDF